MDNSRGPLTRIIRTQHFYCGFPGHRDPLTDAVAKEDLNKVRSYYRQSNLKYCVLYYLIERKKYQMISELIDLEDVDVNYCDPDGYSLLTALTGRYSNTKLSQKLLEKGQIGAVYGPGRYKAPPMSAHHSGRRNQHRKKC
jgi:hypothetical protein